MSAEFLNFVHTGIKVHASTGNARKAEPIEIGCTYIGLQCYRGD